MKTHWFDPQRWWNRWTTRSLGARSKPTRPCRGRYESLESRQVLAADVVISEIYYQPPGNATNERQFEYVELFNIGDTAANLNGWSLRVGTAETPLYTHSGAYTLNPGAYVIMAASTNRYSTLFAMGKAIGGTTNWTGSASLDNAGGTVILRDNASNLIARVDYLDESPWPVFADGFGSTLRIIDPTNMFNPDDLSGGRYDAENWTASLERGGSPAAAGIRTGPGVVFNEILASSNNDIGELDQIELYNTTDTTINLEGWYLTDNDNVAEGSVPTGGYRFGAGTTIGPRGYLTLTEAQFGAGANGFRLDGTMGEQVLLVKPGTGVNPSLVPNATYSDLVEFAPTESSISLGRIPPGEGPMIPNQSQTFGTANSSARESNLAITEVMYNPISNNDDLEFIEILNRGTTTITLNETATSGWRLRKEVDFPDVVSGSGPNFPANTMLAPGERLVILHFDPALPTNAAKKTVFENTYRVRLNGGAGTNPIIKAYGGYTATMSNNDGTIELQEKVLVGADASGNPVYDFVQREILQYEDGGDWPGRADGLGASLERVDPALYSNDSESWRGSFEYNGTPGTAPDPGKTIVINEVLAHTDPPYYDSIELFNMSSQQIDISGWLLAEDVTATELASAFVIPNGTILPAGGYITFNDNPNESLTNCTSISGCHFLFGLDGAEGGNLYLLQRVGNQITRFADNIGYPASFNVQTLEPSSSLARWPNGTGTMFPSLSVTLADYQPGSPSPRTVYMNGANSGPRIGDIDRTGPIGDVIITEVMYNPGAIEGADSLEYIELYNPTNTALDLGPLPEPMSEQWPAPPEGWRLNRAVEYEFKTGEVIPAQGTILVVGFNPTTDTAKLTAFQTRYGIAPTVKIVGPFAFGEHLSDFGGNIELEAPEFGQAIVQPFERFTPNVLVDGVRYDDVAPWPTGPAGGGQSLTRVSTTAFGDFPASWVAASPSPGSFSPPTPTSSPQVSKVVVWGNGWSEEFRTEISEPGATGITGYTIPSGPTQSTVLPWSGINQISITFSEDVEIEGDALVVSGVNTANYSAASNSTYNNSTWTATWQLAQPIGRDRILLDLNSGRISDLDGNALDGEWTDATTSYPSGNGTAGGDFEMRFNVLPGDVDRNGSVNQNDFTLVGTAIFEQIGVGSGYDELRDVSGNGKITVLDWVLTRNQLGQSLPAGSPSPAAGEPAAAVAATRAAGGQNGSSRALAAGAIRRDRLATSGVDRALTLQTNDPPPDSSPTRLRARASRSPRLNPAESV
jgi:hypothetical protein